MPQQPGKDITHGPQILWSTVSIIDFSREHLPTVYHSRLGDLRQNSPSFPLPPYACRCFVLLPPQHCEFNNSTLLFLFCAVVLWHCEDRRLPGLDQQGPYTGRPH